MYKLAIRCTFASHGDCIRTGPYRATRLWPSYSRTSVQMWDSVEEVCGEERSTTTTLSPSTILTSSLHPPHIYTAVMSVPYRIEASTGLPTDTKSPQLKASEKIPIIARPFVSDRAKKTLDIV